ncbi:MAG: hypothetical protein ACREMR_07675 [Gemmatimonadales bacterium]
MTGAVGVATKGSSPNVRPPWVIGSDANAWSLAQECAWLAALARPELLMDYVASLPKRFWGFECPKQPLTPAERAQLHATATARLAALRTGPA